MDIFVQNEAEMIIWLTNSCKYKKKWLISFQLTNCLVVVPLNLDESGLKCIKFLPYQLDKVNLRCWVLFRQLFMHIISRLFINDNIRKLFLQLQRLFD